MTYPYRRVQRSSFWWWLVVLFFLAALGRWWVTHLLFVNADFEAPGDTTGQPRP